MRSERCTSAVTRDGEIDEADCESEGNVVITM